MGYQLDVIQGQASGWSFGPVTDDDGTSLPLSAPRAQVRTAPGRPLVFQLPCMLAGDGLSFTITVSGSQGSAIPPGNYVWDVIANVSGSPVNLVGGRFVVHASVTV